MGKKVFEIEKGATVAFGGVVTKKVKATLETGEVIDLPRKVEVGHVYRFALKGDDDKIGALYIEANGDGTFSEVGEPYASDAFDGATEAKRLPK